MQRRVTVLLDEEADRALHHLASVRGGSLSRVVRDALAFAAEFQGEIRNMSVRLEHIEHLLVSGEATVANHPRVQADAGSAAAATVGNIASWRQDD